MKKLSNDARALLFILQERSRDYPIFWCSKIHIPSFLHVAKFVPSKTSDLYLQNSGIISLKPRC